MAIFDQMGGLPVPGGDLVFKNYSTTDTISAGQGVLFDGTNKGDRNNPPGIVLPTASGGVAKTAGAAMENIGPGRSGRVRILGGFVMTSFATLAPGALVQLSDTSGNLGKVIASTGTAEILGKSLSDAVAGDPILVWINPTSHN